jgi:adenine-specific DNA-methyltransferase
MTSTARARARRQGDRCTDILARAEAARLEANGLLDPTRRSEVGQFMTLSPIAAFMASMFAPNRNDAHLLDAGAGVHSLMAAYVATACRWKLRPASIDATCYEVDATMLPHLRRTVETCAKECDALGIRFIGRIVERDFIEAAAQQLDRTLFGGGVEQQR